MSIDKKSVYFVREGQMHSAWIIGSMDFDVEVAESNDHTTPVEVAESIITTDRVNSVSEHSNAMKAVRENSRINSLVERSGRWYFLSGMNVVHADDLYDTKEEAAEAYKQYLLGE